MARIIDDMQKHANYMAQFKHKCKCGKNVYLSKRRPKALCYWCGRMNYIDKREEFKEKLKNALLKLKNVI